MTDPSMALQVIDGNERMYAPVEMAHIVKLSVETVQGMCRDGRILAVKHGTMWRIPKTEVAHYITYGPREVGEKK